MATTSPAPASTALAALPAIALALRFGDAAACDSAAAQLRDLVATAPEDAAAAVSAAVATDENTVEAAFELALGRAGLSDDAQHALVTAMMMILHHDVAKEAETALVRASPVFLTTLQRIIAQQLPVSASR